MDSDRYPTILHIDIDAFFASVEEALCPALKRKPVVVGGLPNERGVVSCPNYEARRLGVKTAMPLSKAYTLAPNAIFVRGNHKRYKEYSRRFIEILYDFSPTVQAVSLDEAFLDANGCLHFWNYNPQEMAAAIKRAIWDELKITVSIGIASNKLCAKVASDYSKKISRESAGGHVLPPNGLFVAPVGKEKDFLAPLPVSALPGIGRRTTETLEDLGISTVQKLSETPVDLLKEVFGMIGLYLHDAANGIGDSDIEVDDHDAKSISRSTTFGEDSNNEEFISSALFYLAEKVGRSLRKDGLAASTVVMKLRYSDGAPLLGYRTSSKNANRRFVTYQKSYTFNYPTSSEFEIASAAFALFKSLWLEGMKVRLVGVGVTGITKAHSQPDLFESARRRRTDLLDSVDKIRQKFGYHSVYFGIVDQVERKHYGDLNGDELHTPSLSH